MGNKQIAAAEPQKGLGSGSARCLPRPPVLWTRDTAGLTQPLWKVKSLDSGFTPAAWELPVSCPSSGTDGLLVEL